MRQQRVDGAQLRAARRAAGLTQDELARHILVGRQYVCDIERGLRQPSERTLAAITEALGVTAGLPMSGDPGAPLLSTDEVAAVLNLHPRTVTKHLRARRIRGVHVGRQWRVDPAEVERVRTEGLPA